MNELRNANIKVEEIKPTRLYVWYHPAKDELIILADSDMEEMSFRFNCGLVRIGEL